MTFYLMAGKKYLERFQWLKEKSFFLSLLLLIPLSAHSDDIQDAIQAKKQAYSDYYQALKKLGPNPSEDQRAQLRGKILGPAMSNLTNTLTTSSAEATRVSTEALIKNSGSQNNKAPLGGKRGKSPSHSSPSSGGESNQPALSSAGLDGEVVFKGKPSKKHPKKPPAKKHQPKKKPIPKPTSSPSPSLEVTQFGK
jgi:hypothetical protein